MATRVIEAGTAAWTFGIALAATVGLACFIPPAAAAATGCLAFAMALITLADLRHFVIPDSLSLPSIPAGLVATALLFHRGDMTAGVLSGASAAAIAAAFLLALRTAYFRLRGVEGLGLGDVKLAAVAGAWLGPDLLASASLAATLAALVAVGAHLLLDRRHGLDGQMRVPFGSFIAPTILVFWLWRLADVVI